VTLTVGSLFSGIGGIDLGLERAGMTIRWHSEIEHYACRVLHKHWPHVPNLGDIRTIDWTDIEPVDIIAGGYPCQPFSLAGRRAGTDDPRHLWPYFRNAIRHLRPRFALLENVAAHLGLGFGDVLSDLAALGYDTRWDCIPAAAVGAPHLRDRVFVIATRADRPEQRRPTADSDNRRALHTFRSRWNAPWHGGPLMADTDSMAGQEGIAVTGRPETVGEPGTEQGTERRGGVRRGTPPMADTDSAGPQGRPQSSDSQRQNTNRHVRTLDGWAPEPAVGRVADGIPHRMDRLRGLGNAVVPQVAEYLGHIIRSIA